MDDSQRRAEGLAVRRRVLGNDHVDRVMAESSQLGAAFQDLLTRFVWGEIWTRPGLDERTRRVLVIGTLVALGRWDELRLHARAAVAHGGFSRQDLEEIVLQQAVYCGIPAANAAFHALREAGIE